MWRPQTSFSKAQLAISLAIGVPLVILMFAGLRARQLKSTANPRWAQFAKFSGPKATNEESESVAPMTTVKTASLSSDEFSNPHPIANSPVMDLTGSVAGHSTIEMPVRTTVGKNVTRDLEPASESESKNVVARTEPTQQEPAPQVRQSILFRPIDEGQDQAQLETTVRLETQLRDVGRRLDRLSQRQDQLVQQQSNDATKIASQIRQVQIETKKRESIAALRNWLTEEHQDIEPQFVAPRESMTSAPPTTPVPDLPAETQPEREPQIEPPSRAPTIVAHSAPTPKASLRAAPRRKTEKRTSEPTPVAASAPSSHTFVEPDASSLVKEVPTTTPTSPKHEIRIESDPQTPDIFAMEVRDGDVREFFHKLSQTARVSILISPDVCGAISLSLRNVRLETALNAIAKSQGYVVERDGEIMQISTISEAAQLKQQKRTLVMRVYHPSFLTAAELNRLILPMLSSDGRHSSTAATNGAGEYTDDSETTQRDAVIVQDVADVHDRIQQILVEMDVPPLQVKIEAQILSVALPDAGSCGIDLRQLPCTPGANTQHYFSSARELKQATLACNVPTFVDSVSALGETQVLTTQQIQVLNKHRAEMLIGNRIGYQSCASGAIQFLESGTRLVFRPSISADGWIKLEVQPEHHSVQWNKQNKTPRQRSTEMSTHVMVPNAATLAIGGLITEQTIETTNRLPVVGAIPVVGSHFKHRQERVQRRELIILVTPHIVTDCAPDRDVTASIGMTRIQSSPKRNDNSAIDHIERARFHHERATSYLHEGNTVKARQQIEASLHHNQHNAEAHRLRSVIDLSLAQSNTR